MKKNNEKVAHPPFAGAGWALVCLLWLGCGSGEPPKAQVPEVVVQKVEQKNVPLYSHWIGTTQGYNNATIRPQVKGYLREISYKQGAAVKPGDLLFRIDPREFQAQLGIATGELGQAKANLGKAKTYVERYTPLAKQGAVSEQELDDAVQNQLAAEAAVASAEARVAQARLNLTWTEITSPISGVAGISVAQVGDLVTTETVLTTVSQLDPIKVNFPISEQAYLGLVDELAEGVSGEGKLSEVGSILELYLAGDKLWPERGTPYVIGRSFDEETATILIEGRFPNPNNVLRPGQFARIRVNYGERKNALVIPQRAVVDVQGKYMVSVVNSKDIVETRSVEVGETLKENWVITKGLKAGERVVVEGIQKVRSGMHVNPVSESEFKKKHKAAAASGSESVQKSSRAGIHVHPITQTPS